MHTLDAFAAALAITLNVEPMYDVFFCINDKLVTCYDKNGHVLLRFTTPETLLNFPAMVESDIPYVSHFEVTSAHSAKLVPAGVLNR